MFCRISDMNSINLKSNINQTCESICSFSPYSVHSQPGAHKKQLYLPLTTKVLTLQKVTGIFSWKTDIPNRRSIKKSLILFNNCFTVTQQRKKFISLQGRMKTDRLP